MPDFSPDQTALDAINDAVIDALRHCHAVVFNGRIEVIIRIKEGQTTPDWKVHLYRGVHLVRWA